MLFRMVPKSWEIGNPSERILLIDFLLISHFKHTVHIACEREILLFLPLPFYTDGPRHMLLLICIDMFMQVRGAQSLDQTLDNNQPMVLQSCIITVTSVQFPLPNMEIKFLVNLHRIFMNRSSGSSLYTLMIM